MADAYDQGGARTFVMEGHPDGREAGPNRTGQRHTDIRQASAAIGLGRRSSFQHGGRHHDSKPRPKESPNFPEVFFLSPLDDAKRQRLSLGAHSESPFRSGARPPGRPLPDSGAGRNTL